MKHWYDNKSLLIILFFIFFPVGCYGIWKRQTATSKKLLYSIGGLPYFLVLLLVVLGSILPEVDYYTIGKGHYESKEYRKAIVELRKVNEASPDYEKAKKMIEEVLLIEKLEEAHNLFFKAVQFNKDGDFSNAKVTIDSCIYTYEDLLDKYPELKNVDTIYSKSVTFKDETEKEILKAEIKRKEEVSLLVKDFANKVDSKINKIEKYTNQATLFIKDYLNGTASTNQTYQAIEIAYNVCNNENMYSIEIPKQFNSDLKKQCEEVIKAYADAYLSRSLSYNYALKALKKNNDPALWEDAKRMTDNYNFELMRAVAVDMELREKFGLKIKK